MTRACRVLAGVMLLLAGCTDESPLEPPAIERPAEPDPPPAVVPAAPMPAAVTLPACTHRWATATTGQWFDPTRWTPATVPGPGSTACIDAPGTYTVTLDPANDATPVSLDGLSVGGAASGVQTLSLGGVGAAIVDLTTGADVKAGGVLSVSGMGATRLTAPAISNAGTLLSTALCGGCGTPTVRADISNAGTLRVSSSGLILDKADGAYSNTGTIDVLGVLRIPASAGNPSFTLESGSITSTAPNPNNGDFRMLAGTFTYRGGDALSTIRGLVTLEGANLVFGPSPAGTATFSMLPSAAGNTFTGNIGPTHTVRMPLVGGAPTMASRTLTLAGNVTNAGTIEIQPVPGTNFPIIAGSGTLTNTGTVTVTGAGNDSSRIAINFVNRGTVTLNGTHMHFDQPSISYSNEGTLAGTGELLMDGATLINQANGKLDVATRLINGAHLKGSGTNTTNLRVFSGSTVDPGFSPGILTVATLTDINGGILNLELGGQTVGLGYDQIQAAGQTTLVGGMLRITTVNDFEVGKCGHVFDIITHNSPGGIGQFATIEGLNQGAGRSLKIIYGKPAIKLVGLGAGQRVGIQTDPVNLTEGGTGAQYYVCLGQQPTANVTITPAPDAQATVSPASITFTSTDWELPKAFTVTAVDDQATEGAHTGSVSHAVSSTDAQFNGFATSPLVANITDNDNSNRNPTASNDAAATPQGDPVVINVLSNDSDPDGDGLTVSAVTQPSNGSAVISGGGQSVTYTPSTGFSGSTSFSYTASDGKGGSATGSVTVTVTAAPPPPGNRSPNAANDAASTRARNPVVISVLANDSDPDGDPLRVSAVTQPANGTAGISDGGQTVSYRAPAGFFGTATFSYTASDGRGGSASASVTVTVTRNRPPRTESDIQVRVTRSPRSPRAGQPVTYVVTVRNRGPAATAVRLDVQFSGVLGGTQSGPDCRSLVPDNHFCDFSNIPANTERQLSFSWVSLTRTAGFVIFSAWPTPVLDSDPNFRNNQVIMTQTWR